MDGLDVGRSPEGELELNCGHDERCESDQKEYAVGKNIYKYKIYTAEKTCRKRLSWRISGAKEEW